jgi:Na+-driven multidrug efflux pump
MPRTMSRTLPGTMSRTLFLQVALASIILCQCDAFQSAQTRRLATARAPSSPWRHIRETFSTGTMATPSDDDDEISSKIDPLINPEIAGGEVDAMPKRAKQKYPPTPSLRECFLFALPALGIYACPSLMSLIDASFIGRTSSLELAALGPAGSISDSAPLPLLFLSIAATNLVAKAYAKGDKAGCARISRMSMGLGAIGGTVLGAALFKVATPLSSLYCGGGAATTLAPLCAKYVVIRALALPAVVFATIAQAICIGIKDTRTPLIAVALAGGMNFLGDLLLVNGLGMGIAGAAWATTASQFAAAALLLRVMRSNGFLQKGGPSAPIINGDSAISSRPTVVASDTNSDDDTSRRATIKSLMSFIPFLFVMGVKIGVHNSCAATAASLGGAPAAAHTALLAVAMLCFTFGDVGSSLSQSFLPAFASSNDVSGAGSNRSESSTVSFDMAAAMPTLKQLLKCTFTISATVVCLSSLLLTIFSGQISSDPAVIQQMRKILPVMIATLSIHGTAVTLEGLLLARKDFRGLTMTYVGVSVSVAAWLTVVRKSASSAGLLGVWGCYTWFSASRILAFSLLGGLISPPLRWWRRRLLFKFIREEQQKSRA